jgi:hypothetical protein
MSREVYTSYSLHSRAEGNRLQYSSSDVDADRVITSSSMIRVALALPVKLILPPGLIFILSEKVISSIWLP